MVIRVVPTGVDGIHFLNVYSRAATNLGRWLSNWAHEPITTTDGPFNTIEGYWFWLSLKDDCLRTMSGWQAKSHGKNRVRGPSLPQHEFETKIRAALTLKHMANPTRATELHASTLPLCHFYEYNGDRTAGGHYWLLDHWDTLRTGGQE